MMRKGRHTPERKEKKKPNLLPLLKAQKEQNKEKQESKKQITEEQVIEKKIELKKEQLTTESGPLTVVKERKVEKEVKEKQI